MGLNQEKNTFFVGKVLHLHESLPSTNTTALELLANPDSSKPIEGTVIQTIEQSAGRGQQGNFWESERGKNITLSIILYPKFLLAKEQFLLNQAISLGLLDGVRQFIDEGVRIKWSNDLYISQKKVAGILIQNSLSGQTIQSSVIGIGLNVNQVTFLSDAPNPTSLFLEKKETFDLEVVRQALFYYIEKWYLQLRAGNYTLIRRKYLKRLYLLHVGSRFQNEEGQVFNGTIQGVDAVGKLQVSTPKGVFSYGFKEIKFLSP